MTLHYFILLFLLTGSSPYHGDTALQYFRGRPMAPTGDSWARAVEHWKTLPSDADAKFDREVAITAADVIPTVTWGTSPQDVVAIDGVVPDPMQEENLSRRAAMERSLEYMGLVPNTPMTKIPIDKVQTHIPPFPLAIATRHVLFVPIFITNLRGFRSRLTKLRASLSTGVYWIVHQLAD